MKEDFIMKKLFVGLLTLLSLNNAYAAYYTGNELYEKLKSYKNAPGTFNAGLSMGYIAAIVDSLNEKMDPKNGWRFCVPPSATLGQVNDVVYAYLDQNPQVRHYGAYGLVEASLEKAFPCR